MSVIQEFKEFAIKGNVIDMAVGIIIGGGFGKITTSLVNDIIMPPIGTLISGINFNDLVITLKNATAETPAVTINYGTFINTLLEFFIIAASVFFMIKAINSLKRKEEAKSPDPEPDPKPSEEVVLLADIRDLLKTKHK